MNLSKSIDFLLENAGPVIKYRLRKEILNQLTKTEEENLLEQIYQTKNIDYPTAYVDVRLEPDYQRKYALECDLTFWAVQFLKYCKDFRIIH